MLIKMHNSRKKERGAALFMTVVIVSITLASALAIATIFIRELQLAGSLQQSTAAIFAADAGIETMLYDQWKDNNYCVTATSSTPTLETSSTDPDGDTIYYCVEVTPDLGGIPPADPDGSFASVVGGGVWSQSAGCRSSGDPAPNCAGWTGGCPGSSGFSVRFTVPSALSAGDYWWHARAKDTGSNTWSNFSAMTSFRVP